MSRDLVFASALEQAALVRDGEVSALELTDLYLDRIDEFDGDLNAYVTVLADEARGLAKEKDAATASEEDLPPFHGVPVSIKELSFLAGVRATLATRSMEHFVAPFDDEAIARLKRAGMVPLGKTNAPELGSLPVSESELFGPARNPWDPSRTPGGSSGGAAAALAAGLCPIAQGSDGAGSLRIPASCCGVYTLKPSRYRVSNAPMFVSDVGLAMTTKGMLTRTVADAAATLDVIAGWVPGTPGNVPPPESPFLDEVGRDVGRLRVGVVTSNPRGHVAPPVQTAIDDARGLLTELGHETEVVDVAVPDDVYHTFSRIWGAMVDAQPFPLESIEPYNRWLTGLADDLRAGEYLAAEWRLLLFVRDLAVRFGRDFDVLLAPVLTELPIPVGTYTAQEPEWVWEHVQRYVTAVTPLANVAGLPAAGLPLYWDEESGLPVGVQILAQLGDEALLLRLSAQLEAARPWAERRPPGFS